VTIPHADEFRASLRSRPSRASGSPSDSNPFRNWPLFRRYANLPL
jgi:hypothetical protein